MDNRRFVTFLVFFFAFTYVYTELIMPKFFPQPKPALQQPVAENAAAQPNDDVAADGDATSSTTADAANRSEPGEAEVAPLENAPAIHPNQRVTLGSLEVDSGYFLQVQLSSAGAAIETVQLTDPKFRELTDDTEQVTVVGTNTSEDRTFTTAVTYIDQLLAPHQQSLETIDWEIVSSDADHVTFAFDSPDGVLQVQKTFGVNRISATDADRREAFVSNASGFTIDFELTVSNLSAETQALDYELQGPVGVVLENDEHTRKYLDIKLEFLGDADAVTMGAKAVDGLYESQYEAAIAEGKSPTPPQLRDIIRQKEPWTGVARYAAIDVQFFAALVSPLDDRTPEERLEARRIDRIYPVMVQKDRIDVNKSDISFRMVSTPEDVPAGATLSHKYAFFVGPKRSQLLDPPPLEATQVLDYGSWFGRIARGMHYLLDTFHGWGMPYFLAIISLTVLVRGCMFPLSRKQAISAARMKELQPKIKELQVKYGDDKQKIAQAQMELWRKNNINPLSGCFPLLFQFPVFIALYTCLNTAVDLRLSEFLWIENLAAPDALARMPRLPFLGSDFNLLPCITVVLFLVQQKMFMPPAVDEQQQAQQKMMNFMTIFMGVMFWHVPAGLCIYFIASSLWGIAERQLLGKTAVATNDEEPSVRVIEEGTAKGGSSKGANTNGSAKKSKTAGAADSAAPKGFFAKLMDAAEQAQKQAEQTKQKQKQQSKGNRKKGK